MVAVAPAKQQFNIYLPAELVRRVKHAAVDADRSLSDFVAAALEAYLREPEALAAHLREPEEEERS
jgi:predicted transcriptional regulator